LQADLTMGNLAGALALQPDEAALVRELRAGSEEAFAWLIAHYHQPIYSLLARTVRNSADAADLTQEVFVKVFRGIHGFHGESSLRTWIYRIALREASNQRRWWMRHQQHEIPIEQEIADGDGGQPVLLKDMLVDPSESPYDAVLREENRSHVEEALKQVPEPFRSTLILRDIEGFVYEEVAAMQGINLGTVKSRLVRGRACLKALLVASSAGSRTKALPGMELSLRPGTELSLREDTR
jgi:RNA polymerase sigma-70 factor, ECF subfamily